ncbi:MAG TPA: Rieske 2Fe-2S domain-containing protein [Stellaceae bacterium]|nr:Rieske 2Fe-2S domain-containing protein [Stellaceae bacterium]
MTTAAENEFLTRIGPGTPMGALMRQYWMPACLSSELKADGDPLRLMLLGEKLIAFRDSFGRVGVLDHRCPHRCASLFFGRNEEGGLRCIYHGWKFDTAGNCIDMANLPGDQQFRDKVKAKAYQVAERNGLVFVYMGEREVAPPLPALEAMLCPPQETELWARQRQCNWLQALEGDIDTSHFAFLHGGKVMPEELDPDHLERFMYTDRAPRYHVRRTDWGTMYAAYRPAQAGHTYYRFAHFAFPFWTLFPNGPLSDNVLVQGWVPMDDTHTMAFTFNWSRKTPTLSVDKDGAPLPLLDRMTPTLPNTADWFGRWLPVANQTNDYLIDRDAQRTISYTGISTIFGQDSAVTESMGDITDRTLETLAPSDLMIVMTRRRLLEAAKALAEQGTVPPGVDDPTIGSNARSGDIIAPDGKPWLDAYEETLAQARHPLLAQAAE